ncbi:quercetin dioxygenase-like cupin family protein [Kineosphaera limosa]|uniref:Cupin type-2 domain-containing protein n=1 Tax=Kineosphaera limosa NBRC 100340 TaxID=1184609 RepID=K6WSV1_9MICO|nr:cupin domain-containing protein [Kineosphaera limosa]NYE00276.1 quercetin dioxygenase-like cupin family protein [Kineosphaera limosa]GAB96896.1 hypothetical protein KILIM_051_00390 [Kineosphaera limosa NBRC 100340]
MAIEHSSFRTGVTGEVPIEAGGRQTSVVVSEPGVRVVHFALDTQQGLTEHSAPKNAIVQVLAGAIAFTLEGQTQTLSVGDLVVMAPGARHALVAVEPSRFSLTLID